MTNDDAQREPEAEQPATAPPADVPAPAPAPEPAPQPTLLEIQRRLMAASQPPPWKPKGPELDPTSEKGWETAAQHELRAIREEDLPTLPPPPAEALPPGLGGAAGAGGTAPYPAPGLEGWPASWIATDVAAAPGIDAGSNVVELQQPTALAPTERRWRRRIREAKTGLERAARPVLLVALFGFGMSLGWWTWARNVSPVMAPAPPAVVEPGTTDAVPTQVQSLLAALNADNHTQMQVVVPAEPYRLLAGELARRGVAKIVGARAMATYTSGPDSATEILIGGTNGDNEPVYLNLVVHIHDGQISDFR
jgi:hypothetical protein